jgi:hypothetical protein
MVNRIKWMQRKFEFNQPAGLFPNLLERMRGAVPRLEDMVKGLNDEQLSFKPNGTWSIKEHIGHLSDLEVLHEKRLDEILDGKENLSAADMSNKATNEAEHNTKPVNELLERFKKMRLNFIKRMESLDEETVQRSGLHPRLQIPMRIIDIAYFTSEHDDQHLTVIREILNSLPKK